MAADDRKLTAREKVEIALAILVAAPFLLLWFGVPWLAWILQFFPSH